MRFLTIPLLFCLMGCAGTAQDDLSPQANRTQAGQVRGVAPPTTILPGKAGTVPQITDEADDKAPLYDIH